MEVQHNTFKTVNKQKLTITNFYHNVNKYVKQSWHMTVKHGYCLKRKLWFKYHLKGSAEDEMNQQHKGSNASECKETSGSPFCTDKINENDEWLDEGIF